MKWFTRRYIAIAKVEDALEVPLSALATMEALQKEEGLAYADRSYLNGLRVALTPMDNLLWEAKGGQWEEDPLPWVYHDGHRQATGPGHDSAIGWSVHLPRKIKKES